MCGHYFVLLWEILPLG
uniref:Uncharacterized protein n=1 Tax=Rhizophora mucronata TaxID=61149 RepID=A0A2P2P8M9_RHIMU